MDIRVVTLREPSKPVHVMLKRRLESTVRMKVKEGLLEMSFLKLDYKLIDDGDGNDDHETNNGKFMLISTRYYAISFVKKYLP